MSHESDLGLGIAYIERARPDLAEAPLRRALAQDPDDPERMAYLALVLTQLERAREALDLARQAVGRAPERPLTHYVLAWALIGVDRFKQAEAAARELIRIEPDASENHAVLGVALASMRRWQEALEAADAALAIDPENASAANLRARALIQLGQAEDADFALEGTLRRDPSDPSTHENLGWAALNAGDVKKAAAHYREALRLDPSSDTARAGLVEALKAGNFIYRSFLMFVLWLSRIPAWVVIAVLVGTVLARAALKALAESMPALAPLLWTLFGLIVGLVLLSWIAQPLFNLLLRLHPEGRHALSRVQVRQSNWLLGMGLLFVTLVLLAVTGDRATCGWAAFFVAFLTLPVVTTAGAEGREMWLPGAFSLALLGLGVAALITQVGSEQTERELAPFHARLDAVDRQDRAQLLAALEAWTPEEQERFLALSRREVAETDRHLELIRAAGWIFVAFTWIGGGTLSTGRR